MAQTIAAAWAGRSCQGRRPDSARRVCGNHGVVRLSPNGRCDRPACCSVLLCSERPSSCASVRSDVASNDARDRSIDTGSRNTAGPELSRGSAEVAEEYRIAFAASIMAFVGASYTFSLQARDLDR